ncbi:MAG TPA: hypothetical protein VNO83_02605 [Pseudonocardia sp.]|nr:hypothetical protein [Pseudonocardia sp.]
METTTTCPHCTRPRPLAETADLFWSSRHAPDGAVARICPDCTRSRLVEIETLLPGA